MYLGSSSWPDLAQLGLWGNGKVLLLRDGYQTAPDGARLLCRQRRFPMLWPAATWPSRADFPGKKEKGTKKGKKQEAAGSQELSTYGATLLHFPLENGIRPSKTDQQIPKMTNMPYLVGANAGLCFIPEYVSYLVALLPPGVQRLNKMTAIREESTVCSP